MRHNSNSGYEFFKSPMDFHKETDRETLQYCLGGVLYMPGTKNILNKILEKEIFDLKCLVMCFEDAIADVDLIRAEENVINHLKEISDALNTNRLCLNDIPLIFVRVRNISQFIAFSEKLTADTVKALTGFVFPKMESSNATAYLKQLKKINEKFESKIYGMPILEGAAIAHVETRLNELLYLKDQFDLYKKYILNIRIGGTDMSSLFGVRRGINTSIYDILPVRDAISDILNIFNRTPDGYTISGPVWEYFLKYEDSDLENKIESNLHRSLIGQNIIVNVAIDGLLKEVLQDKSNGMVGKTVIHPSHLRFVNAMQAITQEEFNDANQILSFRGGVVKSVDGNKMNEIGPHLTWARKTIIRGKIYGVVHCEGDYVKLFKTALK